VKIINITKGVVLAENAVCASTVFKRLKGLLGKKSLRDGEALVIKPCNSIHSFFMQFPIDVLFVDRSDKVVSAISSFAPARISKIYFHASYVIELPAGLIKATSSSPGDQLGIS